jgi:hypothetical protein
MEYKFCITITYYILQFTYYIIKMPLIYTNNEFNMLRLYNLDVILIVLLIMITFISVYWFVILDDILQNRQFLIDSYRTTIIIYNNSVSNGNNSTITYYYK